jgi:plastocyanin
MPAWGTGLEGGALLNPEQIHELALMIQNVNWNVVYNDAIEHSGGYPTFPPAPAPAGGAPTPAASPDNAGDSATSDKFTVESHDIFFQPTELEIPANQDVKILLPNLGASGHNFSIDALGISVDIAPGETAETTINAKPGTYEFYCNVPGHKEAGMVGTLVVRELSAEEQAAATANENAAVDESAATADAGGAVPAEAAAQTVTSFDIYFEPKEITIPANTDVTFTLPNDGVSSHDFSIDALGVEVALPPGETQTVVINAKPGSYEYYCNVPGHKEAGMVGTLVVE